MRWLVVFLAACGPGSGLVEDGSTSDTDSPDGPPLDTLEQFQAAFIARYVEICESYEPACNGGGFTTCEQAATQRFYDILVPSCEFRYSPEAGAACLETEWACYEPTLTLGVPFDPPCDSVSICGSDG